MTSEADLADLDEDKIKFRRSLLKKYGFSSLRCSTEFDYEWLIDASGELSWRPWED